MKRSTWLATTLLFALVIPAYAGDKTRSGCKEDAQSCLNHMAAKLKGRGWLGIEMETSKLDKNEEAKGQVDLKVSRVVSGSPAEAAGFSIGDVLVSVNGAKFADNTEEKCLTCEKTEDWKPGSKVQYVVRRDGKEVALDAVLAALPSNIMAQMVGMHMLDHAHAAESAKN